jgi:hypothetical protein
MTRRAPRSGRDLLFKSEAVRGLLTAPRVSVVPAAPAWLLGACAFEGRAVSVIDVVALEDDSVVNPEAPVVILVATPAGLIGVSVDALPRDPAAAADAGGGRTLVVDAAALVERISLALFECGFPPQG